MTYEHRTSTPLDDEASMRVRPNMGIAIALFLGYCVVIAVVWLIADVDYDTFTEEVSTTRNPVALSLILGSAYLMIVTTWLGWWRPALFERNRSGRPWMLVIPVLLLAGAIVNFGTVQWENVGGEFLFWVAVVGIGVGFAEEMLTRGLGLVGARGSGLAEPMVMLFTALMFGVLHFPNILYGAEVGATFGQVVFASIVGVVYYVVRRVTGTLLVTMALHGLWDASLFTSDHSGNESNTGGQSIFFITIAVSLVAAWILLRRPAEAPTPVVER